MIYSESDVNHPAAGGGCRPDDHHAAAGATHPRSVIFDSLPVHNRQQQQQQQWTSSSSAYSQSIHSVPYSSNFDHHRGGGSEEGGATSSRTLQNGGAHVVPDLSNQLYESVTPTSSDLFLTNRNYEDNDEAQDNNAFKMSRKSRRAADFNKRGRRHNQLIKNKKTTCMLYLQVT